MKKVLSLLLLCSLIAMLAACGVSLSPVQNEAPPPTRGVPPTAKPTTEPTEEPAAIPTRKPTPEPATPAPDNNKGNDVRAAYAKYTALNNKLNAQTGDDAQFDMDMNIEMAMTYNGETMKTTMSGNMKMKTVGGKVQYAMVMDMGDIGSMEMYSDGEKVYCTVNGEQVEMDMADLEQQVDSSVNLPDFSEDAVKSCETVQEGPYTRTTMVIDGEVMGQFIRDSMADTLSQLGNDIGIQISDLTLSILADSAGNPKEMDMVMALTMEYMGEKVEMVATYNYVINKLGSGVNIDLSALEAA